MVTLSPPLSSGNTTRAVPASLINRHLAGGGCLQVVTLHRAATYDHRHVGWFSMRAGSLHVRRDASLKLHRRYGRRSVPLSVGDRLLCVLRFGRLET